MSGKEKDDQEDTAKPPRPRWRKKRWRLLAVAVILLIWLDGPGWRWIGRKAAVHFVPGLSEEIQLSGRLTGGSIGVGKVRLEGLGQVEVALDNADVRYKFLELVKGRLEALELAGLHVDIDLSKAVEKEDDPESEPVDPAQLLRDLRERLVPMKLSLRDVSLRVHRDQDEVFALDATSLIHEPGDPDFDLRLGEMRFTDDRRVEAQQTKLEWLEEQLRLDRLELMPALALTDVAVRYPEEGSLDFGAGLLVDEVRFEVATDLETASLVQEAEPLRIHAAAEKLGFPIPAEATLQSLKLEASKLSGGLETLEADLQLTASDLNYDDWTSSRQALALRLTATELKAVLEGEALGSPSELQANVVVSRENGLVPETARVDFTIPELAKPLTVVRDRFTPSEDPVPPPASSLKGQADLKFAAGKPDQATAKLAIVSSTDAPPISIEAEWRDQGEAKAIVAIPGVSLNGGFTPEAKSYVGEATLDAFKPDSLKPWLAPFGIAIPGGMTASLTWKGDGELNEGRHSGDLEISSFEWQRGDDQPIKAFATANYNWPEQLKLTPLNVQQAAQKVEAEVTLADQVLELRELSWTDGNDKLLNGSAKVPVPEDLSDWKALLRETRPVEIDLKSTRISLSKLHPYLGEDLRFRSDSAAELDLKLTGTPAEPVLDARFVAENLGLASKPDLPIAGIDLTATGKEQTLKLEGDVASPGFPPAKIDAVTNWNPDVWAEDPEVIKQAKLEASAKISDFNLNLLSRFLPSARKLEGNLNIDLDVNGTVGDPKPVGKVTLDGASLEMKDPTLPRFKSGSMNLTATPEKIDLAGLKASMSGGTLDISGSLDLAEGAPSNVDLKITGNQLPARRDESMIIRANVDMSVRGPWEKAIVAGEIALVDSLFYKDIEILPIGVPFNQPSEPSMPAIDAASSAPPTDSVPAPFRDWALDLKLLTKSPFLIRGNLASGEVYLNVAIGGTIGAPRPSGDATLREITAKLPFSTLKIADGKVKFRPDQPFDPVLNIRGESTIRPYEVKVYIYGPVSNPKILPTSNPPLPETEIMTLVATGTTTSGFEDPDAATARAAQLLIEEIRQGRVRYLRNLGPLLKIIEKVDFQVGEKDPYTSTKYNSATINLDDNWLIRAGISDEGNTRTSLIYLFRFR